MSEHEPGHLLLQLLSLLGWQVAVSRVDGVRVTARRAREALLVEATGRSLAEASFSAYEQACDALWRQRNTPMATAA